jgi:flagella basal body P-ring formation protein FlgA
VTGVVIGRGQVSISVATPRLPPNPDTTSSLRPDETASPVSLVAGNLPSVAPKTE